MNSSSYRQIKNIETIQNLYEMIQSVIFKSSETKTSFFKKKNWSPVIYHENLINPYNFLSSLCQDGVQEIVALSWSDFGDRSAVIFSPEQENCYHFMGTRKSPSYILFSGEPDWLILMESTLDFYFLYGDRTFLENIIGCSFNNGFKSIEHAIEHSHYMTDIGRIHFKDLLHKLQIVYPTLKDNEIIEFEFT